MPTISSPRLPPVLLLSALLAFAFLGSRPLWDPDEGRYTNVALNMLDSGDWLTPMRHHETGHWTKPPVTYWAIASSIKIFGRTAWATRLPNALAYLATVLLTFLMARRLIPGREGWAALAFAVMPLPALAVNIVNTDFLLTVAETAAMAAYVEACFGASGNRARWILAMWVAFAVAFLVKGPPALLPLAAIGVFQLLTRQTAYGQRRAWLIGFFLFLSIAGSWFVVVALRHPGLMGYFLGEEVVDRIATDLHKRHGQWYGWLTVYAPTLLLGALPYTALLLKSLRKAPGTLQSWRQAETRRLEAPHVFMTVWLALPLLIFCLARSRLPLYLLPLFVPIALFAAQGLARLPTRFTRPRTLALWVVLLLAIKAAVPAWPTHKNAAAFAAAIQARASFIPREVVFVEDMARYGIRLYMNAGVEKVSLWPEMEASPFDRKYDHDLLRELTEPEASRVFVTKLEKLEVLRQRAREIGYEARVLGTPFEKRVALLLVPILPANAS